MIHDVGSDIVPQILEDAAISIRQAYLTGAQFVCHDTTEPKACSQFQDALVSHQVGRVAIGYQPLGHFLAARPERESRRVLSYIGIGMAQRARNFFVPIGNSQGVLGGFVWLLWRCKEVDGEVGRVSFHFGVMMTTGIVVALLFRPIIFSAGRRSIAVDVMLPPVHIAATAGT